MPRILAVDYGERRVGLALSDERAIIASGPLPTLDRKSLKGAYPIEKGDRGEFIGRSHTKRKKLY